MQLKYVSCLSFMQFSWLLTLSFGKGHLSSKEYNSNPIQAWDPSLHCCPLHVHSRAWMSKLYLARVICRSRVNTMNFKVTLSYNNNVCVMSFTFKFIIQSTSIIHFIPLPMSCHPTYTQSCILQPYKHCLPELLACTLLPAITYMCCMYETIFINAWAAAATESMSIAFPLHVIQTHIDVLVSVHVCEPCQWYRIEMYQTIISLRPKNN